MLRSPSDDRWGDLLMADFRAVATVCEAVVELLRASYRPEDFNNELEFRVFTPRDFSSPMANGVSLFLYRIYPNGMNRRPSGRLGVDGRRLQTELPVELHLLLTIWGREASLQHAVAGWMMRTLEDTPLLAAGVLNAVTADVFRPDETVEVSLTELSTEDLLRIWEVLGLNVYQLSVPYIARVIHLESTLPEPTGGRAVQERALRMGVSETSAAERS